MFGTSRAAAAVAVLAVAATTVSALGNAVVRNNCAFDVTVWSVGSDVSPADTLQPGQVYSELFTTDPKTGGRAIKITREPDGLYTSKPQLDFAYSLKDGRVWYDLSSVFGDAFLGYKLVEASGDTSCPSIVWPNGSSPGGSQVKDCQDWADVTLTLCSN